MPALPITAEEKCLFDLRGYLILPGVLAPDECKAILQAVHRLESTKRAAASPPIENVNDQIRLDGLPQMDPVFDLAVAHPRVLPYLREFLSVPQLANTWCISKGPTPNAGGWHRALPSTEYSCREGVIRNHILNTAWLLTDNNPGDGGLGILPGSHKNNIELNWANYAGLALPGSVEVTGRAGDVVVFAETLIHTGLPKTTPGIRTNMYYNHCDLYLSGAGFSDPDNLHVYCFPPEVRARFNPEQKELTKWMEYVTPKSRPG